VSQFLAGADEAAVTLGFVTSMEYVAEHSGPYVSALYLSVLGRAVDPTGQVFWQNQLGAGATLAQVAAGIINSSEAQMRAIDDYYVAFLQRAGDAAGTSFWLQTLQAGTNSLGAVGIGILASDEYFGNAGAAVP
jgi:hypothetical protein